MQGELAHRLLKFVGTDGHALAVEGGGIDYIVLAQGHDDFLIVKFLLHKMQIANVHAYKLLLGQRLCVVNRRA